MQPGNAAAVKTTFENAKNCGRENWSKKTKRRRKKNQNLILKSKFWFLEFMNAKSNFGHAIKHRKT